MWFEILKSLRIFYKYFYLKQNSIRNGKLRTKIIGIFLKLNKVKKKTKKKNYRRKASRQNFFFILLNTKIGLILV